MSGSHSGGINPKINIHELEHNIRIFSETVDASEQNKSIEVDRRFIDIFRGAIETLENEEGHEFYEHEFTVLKGKLDILENKIASQAHKTLNLGRRTVKESSQDLYLPKIDEIEHYLKGLSEKVGREEIVVATPISSVIVARAG